MAQWHCDSSQRAVLALELLPLLECEAVTRKLSQSCFRGNEQPQARSHTMAAVFNGLDREG